MKGIRKGAWIKCKDKEEAKQILKQLSDEGYSAVRSSEKYIRVTGEPEPVAASEEEKENG